MKKLLFALSILIIGIQLQAQDKTGYDWNPNPVYEDIGEQYASSKAVFMLLVNHLDYSYSEEGSLRIRQTFHRKVRIMDESSIDEFNKIYISVSGETELIDVKARSINRQGRVTEINRDNIKEIEREEDDSNYKIFAVEGVEEGSDVEVFYVKEYPAQNFGSWLFQFEYPLASGEFRLTSPPNLCYTFKSYNGFPEVVSEEGEDIHVYSVIVKDMPAIENEEYAYSDARRARLEYRLDRNLERGKYQLLTWDDAAASVYEIIYSINKNESKALDKLISRMKLTGIDEEGKVKAIEKYIKSNINIQEISIPQFNDIEFVIKNNASNDQGLTRVYANIFKKMGIDHRIVLTVPRDEKRFDPEFQSYNFLDRYLIYIPGLDSYVSPGSTTDRLHYISGLLTATWSLLVEPVKLGNIESAIGMPHYIEPTPYNVNNHNTYVDFKVDVDRGLAILESQDCFRGLGGALLGEYYDMVPDDRKDEYLRQVLLLDLPDEEVLKVEASTESEKDAGNKPDFVMKYSVSSKQLIDFAGTNILVKIGESIGPQVEMYQDEKRTADIENEFNRWYYREIVFTIPEGYRIKNPEVSIFDIIHSDESGKVYGFESGYTLEGNIYKIVINEYYKKIYLDKKYFEEYRKVVNAAADFNKVVLILEKIDAL